ncbi:hypothetical protein D7B24_004779 [Verticillium nonalfalfae]|uniref:Uncharacterized protein n=1 Tax=Verticillium nonalfalfae TaxID=1051616 RepID=A0A3M9YCR1_9PEZI|nr:uncharacterized protein D7B24_004779 [Verticillium nonalfalfae]RNJ58327.1 hypothetical protein D7B24_004779 [Verticillium nonalfalfae]
MEDSYEQTAAALRLAEHQGCDSHVLKTLTILALIYVPASFAAMGYIETRTEDLALFAALALPLVSVTMSIYWYAQNTQNQTCRQQSDQSPAAQHP